MVLSLPCSLMITSRSVALTVGVVTSECCACCGAAGTGAWTCCTGLAGGVGSGVTSFDGVLTGQVLATGTGLGAGFRFSGGLTILSIEASTAARGWL